MHGHAVVRIMRVVHVAQTKVDGGAVRAERVPMVGIVGQRHRIGVGETFDLLRIEIQQVRLFVMLRLPPFRQIGDACDGIGNDGVVKVEQILVADRLRHLTGTARVIGRILQNVTVLRDEIIIGETLLDIAFHQTLTNQEVTGLQRIDTAPLHGAVLHDRQSVQQHLRAGHGGTAGTRPMRVRIRGAGQRTGQRLGP